MDFNLRRLGLTKKSRILSITHANCMDGTGCQICLDNVFKNIDFVGLKYNDVDSILGKIIDNNYEGYDFIFLTDISPVNPSLLKSQNKIILLDHHNTAIQLHNPEENKYVVSDLCGTALTKLFLEKFFEKKLDSLNDVSYLINDYDLWTKNNSKSTFLNELHFFYFSDKFRKRFFDGNTRLTKEEIEYIRERKKQFQSSFDELEVYDLNKINACYFEANSFLNELCEKLLKMKYDVVFCRSPNKNSVSVRNKHPNLDVGDILKQLGYGGGHKDAAGFYEPDFTKMKKKICDIEDVILEQLKRIG